MLQENIRSAVVFVVLILLQFLLFSNINFLGVINPFVYILFLVRYRLDANQTMFIFLSFLLGFFVDLILETAGAHTIATLTVAFLRPFIVGFSFGINADIPFAMIKGSKTANQLTYVGLLVFIHALIYNIVQYFSWSSFLTILQNALLTTIATFSIIWLILGFNKPK